MVKIRYSILMLCFLLTLPAYGMFIKSDQVVNISEDMVIDDDVLAFGRDVNIRGRINGDVYAFAQNVEVTGEVTGTIFSGAASISIKPKKAKTVWAVGATINISGPVDYNAILFGGSLEIAEDAKIGKDLRAYGGSFDVKGIIGGKIKGSVGKFNLEGMCGGVKISAEEVQIKSGAVVDGDLIMTAEEEPIIEEGVSISGETRVTRKEVERRPFAALIPFFAFIATLIQIVNLIAKIIVGIILIALVRRFTRRIMNTLIKAPWKSLGWGFLGLIVIPVAVVILFIVLIGCPLAIFGIFVYSILFYLASIFVALVIGEKIIQLFKKTGEISLYPSLIIGILVLFVVGWIPILGLIIKIFVLMFGAGALLFGAWGLCKELKEKELI